MNDLSTSKPSSLQNTWSSLPWGTFLFLLAVFVLSTPLIKFHLSSLLSLGKGSVQNSLDVINISKRGNLVRQVALISLGAFALFNLLRSKPGRFQINGLLGWLILFYLVWAALSITWSVDPRFTTTRVAILLILSLGALYVADRFSFQETIALVFVICAVSILGGLVTSLMTHNFLPFTRGWRFGGNMHPIAQGWNCGLLLLSAFALSKTDKQNRAVYLVIAFIVLLLFFLTRSRMSFVSFIIGSAVYWGLVSSKRYQGVLFFLSIIILGCSLFLLGDEFMSFGKEAITLGRGTRTLRTFTDRIPLWEILMRGVDQHPLVGSGYDSFFISPDNLRSVTAEIGGWVASQAHSGYMATLLGLGYIGGVLLVLTLFLSVTMSISLARRNPEYAFMAAVLVWLIFNLVTEDQLLTRPFFPVFVWMIILARLGFIRERVDK